jgi:hypothetical protein
MVHRSDTINIRHRRSGPNAYCEAHCVRHLGRMRVGLMQKPKSRLADILKHSEQQYGRAIPSRHLSGRQRIDDANWWRSFLLKLLETRHSVRSWQEHSDNINIERAIDMQSAMVRPRHQCKARLRVVGVATDVSHLV